MLEPWHVRFEREFRRSVETSEGAGRSRLSSPAPGIWHPGQMTDPRFGSGSSSDGAGTEPPSYQIPSDQSPPPGQFSSGGGYQGDPLGSPGGAAVLRRIGVDTSLVANFPRKQRL